MAAVCFPYKVSIRLSRNGKNLSEFQQSSQLEAHEAAFGKESHVPLNKPIKLENASKSVYVATVLAYCSPIVHGSRENPSEAILHCSYASSSTSCWWYSRTRSYIVTDVGQVLNEKQPRLPISVLGFSRIMDRSYRDEEQNNSEILAICEESARLSS